VILLAIQALVRKSAHLITLFKKTTKKHTHIHKYASLLMNILEKI